MASEPSLIEKLVTYKTAGWALLVAVAGIACLWGSNTDWFDSRPVREATLNQLGGLLVTTGGLGVLWDLRGRRDMMEEVLEKVKVSSDLTTAGFNRATMEWMDVPWADLLRSAKEVEIFISRGRSWRTNNWTELQTFATDSSRKLKLYLPNPDHDATVNILAMRYSSQPEKEREEILDTARELAKLAKGAAADIRIYYRDGDPTYTCYRFDSKVIISLYANRRERGKIPVMVFDDGTFHDFFVADLVAIRDQSVEVAQQELLVEGATP
ncbi:hypothetical protein [Nocardioides aurantiacus]|uniref:hypothetical protein n=1 Tax=Nocardioides aurantiacus TaxID=86796 RepID=UPI00403FADBE